MISNKAPYKKIVMATGNKGKVAELREFLQGKEVEILTLGDFPQIPPIEEKGSTFAENAIHKALVTAKETGLLSLADDSGLEVDALDGRPSVYSARFAGEQANDRMNNLKLLSLLEGVPFPQRTARFISVIAVATPQGKTYTSEGKCEGLILNEFRGERGFGYDPLFYLPDMEMTLAQLTLYEKNQISHRGKALKEAAVLLKELLETNIG